MTRPSYAKTLDKTLRPLGFERQRDDWIRVRGDMWECVNRQSSWLGGVTVNLYIKDLETEKLYLEIFASSGAIQMPPRYTRIGALMGPYDRWWSKDEPDGPTEMAAAVVEYGLPWFDPVRTLEDQATKWYLRDIEPRGPGHLLIGLALTLYRMGEHREACEVLSRAKHRKTFPRPVEEVAPVKAWLGCDSAYPSQEPGAASVAN